MKTINTQNIAITSHNLASCVSSAHPVCVTIKAGIAVMALSLITACSGDSSSGDSATRSQGLVLTPDLSGARPVQDYPTNEQLEAVDGVPDFAQARALIEGTWAATDDATQCVTTFQFGKFGVFATSSLDQRASGEYRLFMEGGKIELNLDYESENFQAQCDGYVEDADALDSGISFGWDVSFPNQNTMLFGSPAFSSNVFYRQ